MDYGFDKIVPRRGTDSYKWDTPADGGVLPLWVADMDFAAAPCIREALARRVEHGVFGYTRVPEAYFAAVARWFGTRHGWTVRREWMQYTTGVVPAISCIVRALCMEGDRVLVTTPVYNCFFSSVRNCGCEVVESPLRVVGGKYAIDFGDFERKCADSKVVAFILCNPHNPGGRAWTADELRRVGDICRRHGVRVVSDEIHNELVMPGWKYTPFASVSEENQRCSVTCVSPSKSFNIAGLQIATVVCSDPWLSRRIDRAINIHEVCDVNPFGVVATQAAYTEEGAAWLDALNAYVSGNYRLVADCFGQRLAAGASSLAFRCMPLEATYLAWIDCSELCARLGVDSDGLAGALEREARVAFSPGSTYGAAGEGYIRINMACPRSVLAEALDRFVRFVAAH